MKKLEYPQEVTEENFKKLAQRAKEIADKSSITLVTSLIVSVLLLVIIILLYIIPYIRTIQDPQVFASIALVASGGLSFFTVFFLVNAVSIALRRIFTNYISYYPSPEEFIFAQCILIANLYSEKKESYSNNKGKIFM